MASPQKEHGFTPYANELYRALIKHDLSGQEWRVLGAIAIDTYGRSRKETPLSIRRISEMTGLRYQRVQEAMRKLVSRSIVTQHRVTPYRVTDPIVRKIQKDYDQWRVTVQRADTVDRVSGVTLNRVGTNKVVVKKDKRLNTPPSPGVRELVQQFYDCLEAKIGEKIAAFPGAALGKLFKRSLSHLTKEEIQKRIEWWFLSDEPFIQRNGWSGTLFISRFSLLKGGPIRAPKNSSFGADFGAKAAPDKYAKITENG